MKPSPTTALVLAAHGSSHHPEAADAVRRMADAIRATGEFHTVVAAFLKDQPRLCEVIVALAAPIAAPATPATPPDPLPGGPPFPPKPVVRPAPTPSAAPTDRAPSPKTVASIPSISSIQSIQSIQSIAPSPEPAASPADPIDLIDPVDPIDRIDRIIVIPVFTSSGHFTQTVLPRELALAVAAAQSDTGILPVTSPPENLPGIPARDSAPPGSSLPLHTSYFTLHTCPPVGEHPFVRDLLARRVAETVARHALDPDDTAVVLIGHGTRRNPASAAAALAHAEALRHLTPIRDVIAVFLDQTPGIEDVYALTLKSNLIVLPYLIGGAGHERTDIPVRLGIAPWLERLPRRSLPAKAGPAQDPSLGRPAQGFSPASHTRPSDPSSPHNAVPVPAAASSFILHPSYLPSPPHRIHDRQIFLLPALGDDPGLLDAILDLARSAKVAQASLPVTTPSPLHPSSFNLPPSPPVPFHTSSLNLHPFPSPPVPFHPSSFNLHPCPGTVYLIGAGPGDPELITLRGHRILREADVVLHDHLIAPEMLSFARPDAEIVDVGKRPGYHRYEQSEINDLLIDHARRGRIVARLKGGDPFVFGRGGEEMLACEEAGVPVEIVPGITSAISVPASAGIPVTHRGISRGFAVVTAVSDPTLGDVHLPYDALAQLDTVVILMGLSSLRDVAARLMESGRASATPVACIQSGWTPDQQVVTGTLGTIADEVAAAGLRSPVTTIVGEVTGFASRISCPESEVRVEAYVSPIATIAALAKGTVTDLL